MNVTESESLHKDLEKQSVFDLLRGINQEDATVALCVDKAIPQIEKLTSGIVKRMKSGGRLFYIGAGTSGRLGILDASECPPTFGVDPDTIIGLIAGGDVAIRNAVEFAEDNTEQAWTDLLAYNISCARCCNRYSRIGHYALCNWRSKSRKRSRASDRLHLLQ